MSDRRQMPYPPQPPSPDTPPSPVAVAFVDESFHEHPTAGFYVLAAAIFEHDDHVQQARDAMLKLRGSRRTGKTHWNEMDSRDRLHAAELLVEMAGVHLVTVGAPVPERAQERARAVSLRRLLFELHQGFTVEFVLFEARQATLDRADITVVQNARYDLPKGARIRAEHQRGDQEPALWLADILAGIIRADREGEPRYLDLIRGLVQVVDVDCT